MGLRKLDPKKTALVIVDVQNDFMQGNVLGVEIDKAKPNDQVTASYIEKLRAVAIEAKKQGLTIVTTLDYHPIDHPSFSKCGGIWPDHCVQGTHGCDHPPNFPVEYVDLRILKGMSYCGDGYSGAGDILDAYPNLAVELAQKKGIENLIICGVATEYCVLNTAVDSKKWRESDLKQLGREQEYLDRTFGKHGETFHVSSMSKEDVDCAGKELEKMRKRFKRRGHSILRKFRNEDPMKTPLFKNVIVLEDLVHPVTLEGGRKALDHDIPKGNVEMTTWDGAKNMLGC